MTSYIYLVIVIKLCKFCLYDSDEQLRERERERERTKKYNGPKMT